MTPIAQRSINRARRRLAPGALERRTKTRVRGLLLVSLLAFGGIGLRLVQIQTLSAPRLHALAIAQRLRTIPLSAERGGIFDRNGSDLAISVTRDTVYADPTYVRDPGLYAAKLAPVVGVSESVLYRKLLDGKSSQSRYVPIAKTVDDSVSARVRSVVDEFKLAGVGFLPEPKRVYPSDLLAAPLIGTVGTDQTGLSGLESQYESMLRGHAGTITVEVDQQGHEIPRTTRKSDPARRGSDLVLSVDENLQYQVEGSLADQVAAQHAAGGTAVVIDVRTGDVLAMASVDGMAFGSRRAGPLEHNRPMTDVLEPGSTNKAITVATALENRFITPTTQFDVPDSIQMGGHTFADDEQHAQERLPDPHAVVERRRDPDRGATRPRPSRSRAPPFRSGQPDDGAFPRTVAGPAPPGLAVRRHRYGVGADRLRARGDATTDARRVHHARQRWGVGTAAPRRRDDRAGRAAQ